MIGKGRELANQRQTTLTACVLGHQVEHIAHQAIAYGADRVILVDDPVLKHYRTEPYAAVLVDLIRQYKPEIFILGGLDARPGPGRRRRYRDFHRPHR